MPPSLNRLVHLHLPNPIPYTYSLRLQEAVLNRHWAYRDALRSSAPTATTSQTPSHPPPPTLLTFSTHPTYTVGRRHLTDNPLSSSQIAFLTGVDTALLPPSTPFTPPLSNHFKPAEFHPSPRGGLLTYHSPGQLTAYPLIDLRRFSLSARNYIRLLEDVVIRTCAAFDVANVGRSCGDPGVWVLDKETGQASDRKICAVGVRVTRGVGSHGIGLNVFDAPIPAGLRDMYKFQDPEGRELPPPRLPHTSSHTVGTTEEDTRGYLSWGFRRIVACGLEGKRTTWLTVEGADAGVGVDEVAEIFARELLEALNAQSTSADGVGRLDGVEAITQDDILSEITEP